MLMCFCFPRTFSLALACSLALARAVAAEPGRGAELGFPLLRAFMPELERAEVQSFDVQLDRRGVLYVANLGGVLTYDGAWWRILPIGTDESAYCLAADAQGRIGVGGNDDFGVISSEEGGRPSFQSLARLLPSGERSFGQVLRVVPSPTGFVFSTEHWLLAWNGGERLVKVLKTRPGEAPARLFAAGDEVYVWTPDGLHRLAGNRLLMLPGGEALRNRRVDLVLAAPDGLLISIRGEGLFLLRQGRAEPFSPAASRWAREKRVFSGSRLPDGRWALGSIFGGLLLLSPEGEVERVIDSTLGLPDDFVYGLAMDREGALWLALNVGLVRLEVASPLSVIDRRSGLAGLPYAATRHQGQLWVATASGVFTVAPARAGGRDADEPLQLEPVAELRLSAWSLLSLGSELLVGTVSGVYLLPERGPPQLIPATDARTAYVLAPSTSKPGRVWVGLDEGLMALERTSSGWRVERRFEDLSMPVRSILEVDGVVWCGTENSGTFGIELPLAPAGTPPALRWAEKAGAVTLARLSGRIVAVKDERVFEVDPNTGKLLIRPELSVFSGHGSFTSLAEDAAGNVWLNTRPVSVAGKEGNGWSRGVHRLVELPARTVDTILPEPDGVVWLIAENGLYRYAGDPNRATLPLPPPALSAVTNSRNEDLALGPQKPGAPLLELPPSTGRLRISFAPLSFRPGLRYETRLEPLEETWSPPRPEPVTELARLPPGRYTFRARTLGPSSEAGPATTWSFQVLPPWYETPWAVLLWAALGIALVRGYVRLRHRALRQRAAELEQLVGAQTVELRRTVDELRQTQSQLESANVRLEELSLSDELTGIGNRRRLLPTLEAEWGRAARRCRPIAFILLDLDHFKLLNDSRGHLEGDLCLQAVGRYLAQSIQRSGDLVVRYGGEEFAVLLPDTDLEGACHLAEKLRAGLEALALQHESVASGCVTASFGVASLIPLAGQRPETLIDLADQALYRAKSEGRNLVRAAAEMPHDVGSRLP
ncbi:MAG: diguanylate cyclase [Thermoanaerobaculia bacterium]